MKRVSIRHIQKVYRFVLSNLIGTLVDTLILWILSRFVFSGYIGQYLLSPFVSFECAVLINYICSRHFVWPERVKNNNPTRFWRKYLYYNISSTSIFALKMVFLLLFEQIFGWPVVICNLTALCISGMLNFFMGEWILFKRPKS